MTYFSYQRTITYMPSASMLPQAFSRSNSNPSHQRNRLLFTRSSMLQLPSCSRLRVHHQQDIDCTYNMNVHVTRPRQSTHPRANIQPHPLSKQNRLVPEHLTPASETTPVTRVGWPTVLQRKANHNSSQTRRQTDPRTPQTSRSRMMTCRRLFERDARLHWPLACTV
jgi:hypothetical protein